MLQAGAHLRDRDQRIAQLEARVAEQDQQALSLASQVEKEIACRHVDAYIESMYKSQQL